MFVVSSHLIGHELSEPRPWCISAFHSGTLSPWFAGSCWISHSCCCTCLENGGWVCEEFGGEGGALAFLLLGANSET